MKNKLQKGDIIKLRGAPSDEHIPKHQRLDTTRHYTITDTSTKIPTGSGQAIKIDGHPDWLDSAWATRVKKAHEAYRDKKS
jgi:hypothetical protein